MKIRAAISYHFGRTRKLGRQQWVVHEDGTTSGNPSLSPSLADSMLSLQRRKVCSIIFQLSSLIYHFRRQVRAGEQVTSARAITHDIIKQLYEYNEAYSDEHSIETIPSRGDPNSWANGYTRRMLHFAYLIAMFCMLRFDEALKIEFHHIELRMDSERVMYLEVLLPWRKTHQLGSKSISY